MTGRVLVTAANGRTGRAVVAALHRRGAAVRAMVRAPAHLAALPEGVEGATGDLTDPASLRAAAEGCAAIVHIGPPLHPDEIALTTNALAAAQAAGVRRFVYYSVMHPLRQDVFHHRQKLAAEAHVVESGLDYTIVQPIRYMQHLEPIWAEVTGTGVHAMPFDVDRRFSVVDLHDVAEAVARIATSPEHRWATYELAGPEPLSQRDMAATLGIVLGRGVVARKIDPETFRRQGEARGIPAERLDRMIGMNAHYDRHGFLGNAGILEWLLGRPATRFADYAARLARERA